LIQPHSEATATDIDGLFLTYPTVCRFVETRLGLAMRRTLPGAFAKFVAHKIKALELANESALASMLSISPGTLMDELIEAVTVPYSWLFRDYEQLNDALFALRPTSPAERRPQVWVPACARGEDAFSISAIAQKTGKDADVLATDINQRALNSAKVGHFDTWSARSIPKEHNNQLTWLSDGHVVFEARVHDRVAVQRHNLLETAPRSLHNHGGWDLIVCRNVLIYFTRVQVVRVLCQLRDALSPDGLLVLGASDIVFELPPGLHPVDICGRLAFKRKPEGHVGSLSSGATKPRALAPTPVATNTIQVSATHAAQDRDGTDTRAGGSVAGTKPASEDDPSKLEARDSETAVNTMLDGIALYLAGELNGAAKQLRAALFHHSELWPASYYLAMCYDELGRASESQREYRRTSELIHRGVSLPRVPNHDFTFLQKDIAGIAQKRATASR
jgi:chemotaxis protein methyltransferase CheR